MSDGGLFLTGAVVGVGVTLLAWAAHLSWLIHEVRQAERRSRR